MVRVRSIDYLTTRNEVKRLEDIVARRVRVMFLDAKETHRLLPEIAQIMAEELK